LTERINKDCLLQDAFGSDFTAVRKETAQLVGTAAASFARYFDGEQSRDDEKDEV